MPGMLNESKELIPFLFAGCKKSRYNWSVKKESKQFINPTRGMLNVSEVVEEVGSFIDSDPSGFYSIIIGTDSQTKSINGKAEVDYVTAVVVHKRGQGGRYFWRKEKIFQPTFLREKIYRETQMSLDFAEEIVPLIRERISSGRFDFEIHIDVGPFGPTRDIIKEVVGMVNGNGYTAKTKPQSWGASSVADKHT
jgi:predicted RNase H-related nuclease YkuK (DUF458 family)